MKELVSFLFKSLTDNPQEVSIESSEEEGTVRFKVKVAELDKGKVIGKNGRVIKTIRTLVSAGAAKQNKKIFLDLD